MRVKTETKEAKQNPYKYHGIYADAEIREFGGNKIVTGDRIDRENKTRMPIIMRHGTVQRNVGAVSFWGVVQAYINGLISGNLAKDQYPCIEKVEGCIDLCVFMNIVDEIELLSTEKRKRGAVKISNGERGKLWQQIQDETNSYIRGVVDDYKTMAEYAHLDQYVEVEIKARLTGDNAVNVVTEGTEAYALERTNAATCGVQNEPELTGTQKNEEQVIIEGQENLKVEVHQAPQTSSLNQVGRMRVNRMKARIKGCYKTGSIIRDQETGFLKGVKTGFIPDDIKGLIRSENIHYNHVFGSAS